MNPELILGLGSLLVAGLGVVYTFRATKGKTKSDAKTALDLRIDKKVSEYMDDLESRLDKQRESLKEQGSKIDTLEDDKDMLAGKIKSLEIERALADRREVLLYRHTKALRDHIINELPPPPPTAPTELIDWFATFEDTDPGVVLR